MENVKSKVFKTMWSLIKKHNAKASNENKSIYLKLAWDIVKSEGAAKEEVAATTVEDKDGNKFIRIKKYKYIDVRQCIKDADALFVITGGTKLIGAGEKFITGKLLEKMKEYTARFGLRAFHLGQINCGNNSVHICTLPANSKGKYKVETSKTLLKRELIHAKEMADKLNFKKIFIMAHGLASGYNAVKDVFEESVGNDERFYIAFEEISHLKVNKQNNIVNENIDDIIKSYIAKKDKKDDENTINDILSIVDGI